MSKTIIESNMPVIAPGKLAKKLSKMYVQAIEENTIPDTISYMLWGAPGIGKSEIVEELLRSIAEKTGKTPVLSDVRLLLFNPVDLKGIPVADENREFAKWLAPELFKMDPSEDVVNVLFFDELSAALPSVQASAYQLILNRRIGEHKLPDNCITICAGNRTTDKSVAYAMPKALGNRLIHVELQPDFEDWKENYALKAGINEKIISFLAFKRDRLMDFDPSNDFVTFPSPRSWSFVDKCLKMNNNDIDEAHFYVSGAIGTSCAVEFKEYCKVYTDLPDIEKILNGSYILKDGSVAPENLPKEIGAMWAVTSSISLRLKDRTMEEYDNIFKYIFNLEAEYAICIANDMVTCKVLSTAVKAPSFGAFSCKYGEYIKSK